MQNFIEQQITAIEKEIDYLTAEVEQQSDFSRTVNVLEAVEKSLQALKAHMIQEFESRLPEEKPEDDIEVPKGQNIGEYRFVKGLRHEGFNECRSIMIEEINKLKN